jgi:hypothetical protein
MQSDLFRLDPMAASSYGIYNSIKGEDGSFLDFLLNYDSKEANEEDNSWINKLLTKDNLNDITSSEVLKELNLSGFSTTDFLSRKSYFDTQVEGYKLILTQEMNKRGIPIPKEYEGADIYSSLLDL